MKKAFALCLFFVIVASFSSQAKIWRVNNNPGINADFTTLQAAHNAAASGDSIYLEGSPYSYGGLTCNKKLFIAGPGYFLDENPNTQSLQRTALVGSFTLNVGSEGTVITGLDFNGNDGNGSIRVFSNDIVIKRNKFSSTPDWTSGAIELYYLSNNGNFGVSNIVITQNFGVQIYAASQPVTNLLIANNYIATHAVNGEGYTGPCLALNSNTVALIQNNIFRRGTVQVYNSHVSSNIMYLGLFSGTGNLFANNIGSGTQFGTGNGNQANVSMGSVFLLSGSSDGQFRLKVGSPAIGAGYGSTAQNPVDCGLYGGSSPYVLAGQPNMPAIYSFENQPIGSNTDPIDVKIKVKSAGN